jgi:aminoglycoside 6'-N-acetyltransferase I
MIELCLSAEHPGWLTLRQALWPGSGEAEHLREMAAIIAGSATKGAFLALDGARRPQGVAEVGLRYDHVNGAASSPVAFLEGIYVAPEFRGRGVARELVGVVETWASALGCTELASDVLIDNGDGLALHNALGFRETERVVYFVKAVR